MSPLLQRAVIPIALLHKRTKPRENGVAPIFHNDVTEASVFQLGDVD